MGNVAFVGARVRALGIRLADLQRPLRILPAVRWGEDVERAFFDGGARKLPAVTADSYPPLAFNPDTHHQTLGNLEKDVQRSLGSKHPAGSLMLRRCAECRDVVDLLRARGTSKFPALSAKLYGHSQEICGGVRLSYLGRVLMKRMPPSEVPATSLTAEEAARQLSARFQAFFGATTQVRVELTRRLSADAAAGGSALKVRMGATFAARDVHLLEVHEGWVHLGTTLNARAQPIITFLTGNLPSTTVTQEGLAVLTEMLAGASHGARLRRLGERVEAVARAEAGADFLEIYRFFLDQGCPPRDAYQQSARIFRGSLPNGGPFTKDISYSKGLLLVAAFLRSAALEGRLDLAPLLFTGKTALFELPDLTRLADEGYLAAPQYLPPPFSRPAELSACLASKFPAIRKVIWF